jgi:hypothetical protein
MLCKEEGKNLAFKQLQGLGVISRRASRAEIVVILGRV